MHSQENIIQYLHSLSRRIIRPVVIPRFPYVYTIIVLAGMIRVSQTCRAFHSMDSRTKNNILFESGRRILLDITDNVEAITTYEHTGMVMLEVLDSLATPTSS